MERARIIDFFEPIKDNRRIYGNRQHEPLDIVAISITAVISGTETLEDVEMYGKAKEKWSEIQKKGRSLG